jgi:hypothetical protein
MKEGSAGIRSSRYEPSPGVLAACVWAEQRASYENVCVRSLLGLGFVASEPPDSLIKRQLDIAHPIGPGHDGDGLVFLVCSHHQSGRPPSQPTSQATMNGFNLR